MSAMRLVEINRNIYDLPISWRYNIIGYEYQDLFSGDLHNAYFWMFISLITLD